MECSSQGLTAVTFMLKTESLISFSCSGVISGSPQAEHPELSKINDSTGNLDSATSNEIMALFDNLHKKGNTIILVTHEPDIATHAHRVIRLLDGKIASDEITKK